VFKKLKSPRLIESPAPGVEPVVTTMPAPDVRRTPVRGKAVYEIADVTVLTQDEISARTRQAQDDRASGLLACAHLVVTRDLSTGVVNHHVPCSSGLEAIELAVQVAEEKRTAEPGRAFAVTVMPLLPHSEG
jgi:hypothetical protein